MTDKSKVASKNKVKGGENAECFDFCSLSRQEMIRLAKGTHEDRAKSHIPMSQVTTEQVRSLQPMTFLEEAACIIFLAIGVPNGVFTIPILTFLIGKFILGSVARAFIVLAVVWIPILLTPHPFIPSSLNSWMAVQITKYFSFRFITEERPPELSGGDGKSDKATKHPQIMVAPPHGVFPYGNVLAMLLWPSLTGHHFVALAASWGLRLFPVLRSIGAVDATRSVARKALEQYPYTIGISTGGVAEVFETNAVDECILLKERVGLVKLAIRTGADLVPCYLFGNTKLLSCWSGEGIPGAHSILEKISRKLGFALIIIVGRFGLPIPFRVPVLGVLGRPIPTHDIKCEEPTQEQIDKIQGLLLDEMAEIFERYKGLYGWEDKRLIIR